MRKPLFVIRIFADPHTGGYFGEIEHPTFGTFWTKSVESPAKALVAVDERIR